MDIPSGAKKVDVLAAVARVSEKGFSDAHRLRHTHATTHLLELLLLLLLLVLLLSVAGLSLRLLLRLLLLGGVSR